MKVCKYSAPWVHCLVDTCAILLLLLLLIIIYKTDLFQSDCPLIKFTSIKGSCFTLDCRPEARDFSVGPVNLISVCFLSRFCFLMLSLLYFNVTVFTVCCLIRNISIIENCSLYRKGYYIRFLNYLVFFQWFEWKWQHIRSGWLRLRQPFAFW